MTITPQQTRLLSRLLHEYRDCQQEFIDSLVIPRTSRGPDAESNRIIRRAEMRIRKTEKLLDALEQGR